MAQLYRKLFPWIKNVRDGQKPVFTRSGGLVDGEGNAIPPVSATLAQSSVLPLSAMGSITPVDSPSNTTQTLPSAAAAWAAKPFGLVILVQLGTGAPAFAAGGGDTLLATVGIGACVRYGMIAAQVQSPTHWALA